MDACQRAQFLATGSRPPLDPSIDRPMKVVQNMIALGGKLDMTWLQTGTEAARIQAAWGKWNHIRPRAQNRATPLRCRVRLLDSVVLPTLLWSLESLQMTALRRRALDGLQRRMVGRTLLVLRRATETAETYFMRRERLISRTIDKSARGKWGSLQQFRQLMFVRPLCKVRPRHPHCWPNLRVAQFSVVG